jgi:hypothetical protein
LAYLLFLMGCIRPEDIRYVFDALDTGFHMPYDMIVFNSIFKF